MIFAFVFVVSCLMWLFHDDSFILTVILNMLIVGGVHGVNFVLVCVAPKRFRSYGNIATMSGILNFSTYVGSALSTYGFAVISEQSGWSTTIGMWIVIAALGALMCFMSDKKWEKL